jgi:HAD superfamily hydrolase (TIGR01549 family)
MEKRAQSKRLVLFDLDDTLSDRSGPTRTALRHLRGRWPLLRRQDLGTLVLEYGQLLEALHPRVLAGELTETQARRERLARLYRRCGGRLTPREEVAMAAEYGRVARASQGPVPGALPLLRALRPRALTGVVSNHRRREQEVKLRELDLEPQVDFLVTSEDARAAKPEPAIFLRALSEAGDTPPKTVMVGDGWETDVRGGRAAGLRVVWFNRFELPVPEVVSPEVPQLVSLRPASEVSAWLLRQCARPSADGRSPNG